MRTVTVVPAASVAGLRSLLIAAAVPRAGANRAADGCALAAAENRAENGAADRRAADFRGALAAG